jgi:hypothetical protein
MERTKLCSEYRTLDDNELDIVSGGIKVWFHSSFGKAGVAANAYQSGSSGAEVLYWLLVP